jgi:hypothetical protein
VRYRVEPTAEKTLTPDEINDTGIQKIQTRKKELKIHPFRAYIRETRSKNKLKKYIFLG